jgi:hypothetical protein
VSRYGEGHTEKEKLPSANANRADKKGAEDPSAGADEREV